MPPSDNPNRHSSPQWRTLRQWVIDRDKNLCQYCLATGHQVDYMVPPKHGGQTGPANMVCCCTTCLRVSNDAPFPTFTDKVAYIRDKRQAPNPPLNLAQTIPGIGPRPYSMIPKPVAVEPTGLRKRLLAKRALEKS